MATTLIREHKRGARLSQMTNQQQMFCKHLLADPSFNLTNAAREAGYKAPRQMGQKLLKHSAIRFYLGNEIRKRNRRLEFTAEEVLFRIKTILEVDITDIYDDEGYTTMEKVKSLPPDIRQCITKIKTHSRTRISEETGEKERFNVVELEWMSKDNALQMAMRHFGLMEPDLKIHVVSDELKAKVLVDLLGHIGGHQNVIDAEAVSRLAQDDNDGSN